MKGSKILVARRGLKSDSSRLTAALRAPKAVEQQKQKHALVCGSTDHITLCCAMVLPGQIPGFRVGFRPDSS